MNIFKCACPLQLLILKAKKVSALSCKVRYPKSIFLFNSDSKPNGKQKAE